MDSTCHCNGTGILPVDADPSLDLDHIVRHDECAKYPDDLAAARALAATAEHGAWLVYLLDERGNLPATEDSHIFLRHSLADVGSLQQSLAADLPFGDFGRPPVVVMVEWVSGQQ